MNALVLSTQYTGTNDLTVIFNDNTPLYNATSAPGGYDNTGVSCYDPSDTDTSTLLLSIQYLDDGVLDTAVDVVIPPASFVIADIGGTGVITYEIPAADYEFSDGIYYSVYSFEDSSTGLTYTKGTYFAVTNTLKCCLNLKLKEIPICPTCDKSKTTQALFEAQMFLDWIDEMLICENYTGAQILLDYLNDFCDIENCSSCH